MATIVNNPPAMPAQQSEGGSGVGVIVGVILTIIVILFFAFYGIPSWRGNNQGSAPAPQAAPAQESGGTTIQVPDKINVDVNK